MDSRRENSYDFVRFCAASAVLFSHHFDLAGRPEPPVPGYGEDFGELAVEIFFCLSGFLICRSLQKSTSWARFVAARFLRIFPNLAFVLVATSAVTFFWYGNYSHLWSHAEYVTENLLMFLRGVTYVIPGVFADTVRPAVNEPLWSLPYELWLYAVLALMFFLGGRWISTGIVLGALLLGIAWSATPILGEFEIGHLESLELFRLGSFFLSGAVLAVLWPYIGRHALAVAGHRTDSDSCHSQSGADRHHVSVARGSCGHHRLRQLRGHGMVFEGRRCVVRNVCPGLAGSAILDVAHRAVLAIHARGLCDDDRAGLWNLAWVRKAGHVVRQSVCADARKRRSIRSAGKDPAG